MQGSVQEKKLPYILWKIAHAHPFIWQRAKKAIKGIGFLLPHDKSYRALKHFVRAGPGLFLDVGANDGISVLSFRKFSRTYRVVSLEPNRLLEPELRRLKEKDSLYDYHVVGAGATRGKERFFVPVYRGVVMHTFTSTSEEQVRRAVADTFSSAIAAAIKLESFESDIRPIDELGLAPDIVKIDVEGFEFDVLKGMRRTISSARPFMIVESAWSQLSPIKTFLEELDFALLDYDVNADIFRGISRASGAMRSQSLNVFAVPKEKLPRLPVDGVRI